MNNEQPGYIWMANEARYVHVVKPYLRFESQTEFSRSPSEDSEVDE